MSMRSTGACLCKEVLKVGICASRDPFCDKSAFLCTLPVLVPLRAIISKSRESQRF